MANHFRFPLLKLASRQLALCYRHVTPALNVVYCYGVAYLVTIGFAGFE